MNKKKETLHWDLDSAGIELHAILFFFVELTLSCQALHCVHSHTHTPMLSIQQCQLQSYTLWHMKS